MPVTVGISWDLQKELSKTKQKQREFLIMMDCFSQSD